MEINWSALIGGFLGGSLSAVLAEIFRRRARKERYAEKLFEAKLAAYRAVAEALFTLGVNDKTTLLRSRMGAGLPFMRKDVSTGLDFFVKLFDEALTLEEFRTTKNPTWRKMIELIDHFGLPEFHPRRQALFLVWALIDTMRDDLGQPLVALLETAILQKRPPS